MPLYKITRPTSGSQVSCSNYNPVLYTHMHVDHNYIEHSTYQAIQTQHMHSLVFQYILLVWHEMETSFGKEKGSSERTTRLLYSQMYNVILLL